MTSRYPAGKFQRLMHSIWQRKPPSFRCQSRSRTTSIPTDAPRTTPRLGFQQCALLFLTPEAPQARPVAEACARRTTSRDLLGSQRSPASGCTLFKHQFFPQIRKSGRRTHGSEGNKADAVSSNGLCRPDFAGIKPVKGGPVCGGPADGCPSKVHAGEEHESEEMRPDGL